MYVYGTYSRSQESKVLQDLLSPEVYDIAERPLHGTGTPCSVGLDVGIIDVGNVDSMLMVSGE